MRMFVKYMCVCVYVCVGVGVRACVHAVCMCVQMRMFGLSPVESACLYTRVYAHIRMHAHTMRNKDVCVHVCV